MRGSPEYRKRYWALTGVRVLALIVLIISLVYAVLGHGTVAAVATVAAAVALVFSLVSQILLGRLIAKGSREEREWHADDADRTG